MTRKDVRSRSEYARFALGVSHSESRVCVLGTSCAMSLRDSQEGDVRTARFVMECANHPQIYVRCLCSISGREFYPIPGIRRSVWRSCWKNVAMSVYQLIQERISPPGTTALPRLHALQPSDAPGTTTTVDARSSTSWPTTPAVASKLDKRAASKLRRRADEKARRSQIEAEHAADQRLGELEQRVRRQVEERATRRGAQAARCEAEAEVSKAEERAAAAERRAGVAEARATRLQLQLNAMRRKVLQSAPDLRGRMRTRVRVSTRKYKSTNQRAHYARARARAHARARRAGTIRPRVAREQ